MFQATAVAGDIDTYRAPQGVGELLVWLVDEESNPLTGGISVTDFKGATHSATTNSGGWALFYDLPPGTVTVENSERAEGYAFGQLNEPLPPAIVVGARAEVTLQAWPVHAFAAPQVQMASLMNPDGSEGGSGTGEGDEAGGEAQPLTIAGGEDDPGPVAGDDGNGDDANGNGAANGSGNGNGVDEGDAGDVVITPEEEGDGNGNGGANGNGAGEPGNGAGTNGNGDGDANGNDGGNGAGGPEAPEAPAPEAPEVVQVVPEAPAVTQATCSDDNEPTAPNVELAEATADIVYTMDGEVEPGNTVIVTATLQGDVEFGDLTGTNWNDQQNGTATYEVVLEDCEPEFSLSAAPMAEPQGITTQLTCEPVVDMPSYISLFIPKLQEEGEGSDPDLVVADPTVSMIKTDRFGVETPSTTIELVDEGDGYRYSLSDEPSIMVRFTINAEGFNETIVEAKCVSWTPYELTLTTASYSDEDRTNRVDGGQVGSDTPFFDTAVFEIDHENAADIISRVNGTVTYNLYKGNTCDSDSTLVGSWPATITNGVIDPSDWFNPAESADWGDGTYNWHVVYEGNVQDPDESNYRGNFAPTESRCGSETVIVGSYDTDISTTMHRADTGDVISNDGGTVPIGVGVYDTTTLTPAGASGTVTYTLYKGETCDEDDIVLGPETTDAFTNGDVPASSTYTPTALGKYSWVVEFTPATGSGYDAITSECGDEVFEVVKATPSITTTMYANGEEITDGTAPRDATVHDTTQIDGVYGDNFGGTLTYTLYHHSTANTCDGAEEIGSVEFTELNGELPDSNADVGGRTFTADKAGYYNWVVHYSGDDFNEGALSDCGEETFTVAKNTPDIDTVPQYLDADDEWQDIDQNGVIPAGSTVRDTAVVTNLAGTPSGTVTFTLYKGVDCAEEIASVSGELSDDYENVISGVVEDLDPGQYNWVVTYAEDDENAGVTTDCGKEQFFVRDGVGVDGYVHTVVKNAANDNTVTNGATVDLGTKVYDTAQFYGELVDEDGKAAIAGTLTYTLYKGDSCADGSPVAQTWDPMTVTVGGDIPAIPADQAHHLVDSGRYEFQAVFVSEDGETTISSPCGTETVNVSTVQPTLTTKILVGGEPIDDWSSVLRPNAGEPDLQVEDSVTFGGLVEGVDGPNGTVTYRLYKGEGCEGTPEFTSDPIDVENGVAGNSGTHPLTSDDYGTYRWQVTFTPGENEHNYTEVTTDCWTEVFYLEAAPTISTAMEWREGSDGDVDDLENGDTVTVGDGVRDTATLTGATSNAGGTVTFTLHQGSTCEGAVLFTDTVNVVNGELERPTNWHEVRLYGNYSWQAVYSGDISGGQTRGYNKATDPHCEDETFVSQVNTALEPSMTTVMRYQNGGEIKHESFIVAPATVTDQAVFKNLSDEATGTVTYTLYASASSETCDSGTQIGQTSTKTVTKGIAPQSDPIPVPAPARDSMVYSWVVVFEGTDGENDVRLTSDCHEEQFRAFASQTYTATSVCTYHGRTDTMSVELILSPRDVNNQNLDVPATITFTPKARNLEPLDAFTLDNVTDYIVGPANYPELSQQPWREVFVQITWDNGATGAEFTINCVNKPYQPIITTAMLAKGDGADEFTELSNGAQVAPGTEVMDTAKVLENTSTYQLSGTLTYTLYKGPICDISQSTVVGEPQVKEFANKTPSELPDSDTVPVSESGTYFWVVEYTPGSGEFGADNNQAAVSDCSTESFSVTENPQDNVVVPSAPSVAQGYCTDENEQVFPTVQLSADGDNITYSMEGDLVAPDSNKGIPGGTVIVTATINEDDDGPVAAWNEDLWPAGWVKVDETTATYRVELENIDCGPVIPATPTVNQAVCTEDNEPGDPSVATPDDTDLITYALSGTVANGETVIITATLLEEGNTWEADADGKTPNGWTVNPENDREATYTIVLETPICDEPVIPVAPSSTDGVCEGGEYTPPTVTPSTEPEGVSYDVSEIDEDGNYTVTATLGDKQVWDFESDQWPSADWKPVDGEENQVRYSSKVDLNECDPVVPVMPTVTQAVCTDEGPGLPMVETEDGNGIRYSFDGDDVVNGGSVVITAELENGKIWDTAKDEFTQDDGWTVDPNNPAKATYTLELDDVRCPVAPEFTNSVCTDGVPGNPSVDPIETDGISYTIEGDVENGATVIVRATLDDGKAWPKDLPEGWTLNEDDNTATYTVELDDVRCPVAPTIDGNACTGGAFTPPELVLDQNPDIDYTYDADDVVTGNEVVITATLKPGFDWPLDLPEGWTLNEDGNAAYTLEIPDEACEPLVPVAPKVTEGVCEGGAWTEPKVERDDDRDFIDYVINFDPTTGSTYTVTATLPETGYSWNTDDEAFAQPGGWNVNPDDLTEATLEGEVDLNECEPAVPVIPSVDGNVCEGGEYDPATVNVPDESEQFSYDVTQDIDENGDYVVVATVKTGFSFGDLTGTGWVDNEDGTATYNGHEDLKPCIEVIPVTPEFDQAVCTGGELLMPEIFPAETEGIDYSWDEGQVAPGATVIVTATVQNDYGWPAEMPEGWERVNDETATTEIELEDVECEEVVPAAPIVEQVVCTGGTLTEPSVTIQTTNGIEYTFNQDDVVNGGTVIVTATVQNGHAWADTLPQGWDKIDSETATYKVELDDVDCTPVIPAAPTVTQTVCTGGTLTDPSVTPVPTEGIIYTYEAETVVNGGTVVITATVKDGYAWGEMPEGWTKVDDSTATYTVKLDDVECVPVVPEAPIVEQPVCEAGSVTEPRVTVPETEGVDYTFDGEMVPGGTVTITATVQDGYGWPSELPQGWTRVDDTTATYTVSLSDDECIVVDPGVPAITHPVCTEDGTVQDPTITLPEIPGVTYTTEGKMVPGGTVTVTATLEDGYAWPAELPEGWTKVNDTTASFVVTFDAAPDCEDPADPADPVAPADPVQTLPTTGAGSAPMAATGMAMLLLASLAAMTAAVAAWLRREGSR